MSPLSNPPLPPHGLQSQWFMMHMLLSCVKVLPAIEDLSKQPLLKQKTHVVGNPTAHFF
jgi:hypothetical protein